MNGVSAPAPGLLRKLPTLALLLVAVAMLAGLGVWQYHRGRDKAALIEHYQQALRAAPVALTHALGGKAPSQWIPVSVHGRYLEDRTMRLDNQSHGDQVGFEVWTPLRTDQGDLVIVDRGWIPHAQIAAAIPPPPSMPVEVRGLWRGLPEPGLRLGDGNCPTTQAPSSQTWPVTVEYPTAADLHCLLGEAPLAGVVLLAADAEDGFLRDWHPAPGFPPVRHYAYSLQWFALSLTLLVLGLRLLFKRSS